MPHPTAFPDPMPSSMRTYLRELSDVDEARLRLGVIREIVLGLPDDAVDLNCWVTTHGDRTQLDAGGIGRGAVMCASMWVAADARFPWLQYGLTAGGLPEYPEYPRPGRSANYGLGAVDDACRTRDPHRMLGLGGAVFSAASSPYFDVEETPAEWARGHRAVVLARLDLLLGAAPGRRVLSSR